MRVEAELLFYCDVQTGAVLRDTGQHIRLLLGEAKQMEHYMQVAKEEADTD
jgi:hypothetical protein